MDKSAKIMSIILGILAVILLAIYGFLSMVNKQIPKELEFPASNMSQSIFDSQNTKYVQNAAFTGKHIFTDCPYMIDVAETDKAKVSDVGVVYKVSESMYFYVTEFEKETNIESVLRAELPQAVMIDSNAEMTAIDNYVYDEGYVNGFKGDYYIDCMTVTNGTRTASVYITGYALTITDQELDHGHKMFVGIVSAVSDTDTYATGKQILDSVVATYQVNWDVQKALVDAENAALAEEERLRNEAIANGQTYVPSVVPANNSNENLIVSSENSTTDLASNASASPTQGVVTQQTQQQQNEYIRQDAYMDTANGTGAVNNNAGDGDGAAAGAAIPVKKTKSMELVQEYSGVTLYYYYQNEANEITVTLENPTGDKQYAPTSTAPGTIIFKLDKMEAGKWHVYVSGDAGTDSMRLYSESENASAEQTSDGTESGTSITN